MPKPSVELDDYNLVELQGIRYAIVPERALLALCRRAKVKVQSREQSTAGSSVNVDLDGDRLAEKLVLRRKRAGLTQVELARRAGIRVETLNRVERGRTTPDFSTIRKLVVAMDEAEAIVLASR